VTPLVGQLVDETQTEPARVPVFHPWLDDRHAIGCGGLFDGHPDPIVRTVHQNQQLIDPIT
jgi:hypothetical protein